VVIAVSLTKGALLIFLQSRFEKLLTWLWIEPTTSDLSPQSGAFDHSAMPTLAVMINIFLATSDGFGSKFLDLGRVGSIFCGSGRVGSGQPFMVWV